MLLLQDKGDKVWECLVRPGKHLREGARVSFGDGELTAEIAEVLPDGNRLVRFDYNGIFLEVLERLGKMASWPPYIKEELQDQERYQTVYSKVNGSAAAPTAGLHFTPELLERIAAKGVGVGYVTLHVGSHVPTAQGGRDRAARYAQRILHHSAGDGGSDQPHEGERRACDLRRHDLLAAPLKAGRGRTAP